MTSEILLTDGEAVTTLPATPEEKAQQLPEPVTYHLLCALPDIDDKYESGLVKAGQTMHRLRLQGYTWKGQRIDVGWVRLVVQAPRT